MLFQVSLLRKHLNKKIDYCKNKKTNKRPAQIIKGAIAVINRTREKNVFFFYMSGGDVAIQADIINTIE